MADDELRRLVRSSAAQPPGEPPLDDILDRAQRRRSRRRTAAVAAPLLVVLAGVAAVVLALPGSEVEFEPVEEVATPTPTPTDEPEPTPTPMPTPTPTPAPTPTPTPEEPDPDPEGTDTVTVFYAREHDSGVWVEPETVTLDEPTVGVARAAMTALVETDPAEPGLVSLAADGAELRDVNLDGDVLVADFSGLVDGGLGAAFEAALVQQIVHTGAQFDTVGEVQILVDGQQVETLAGHVDVREPLTPDPFALSPITITTHMPGEQVPVGEVTVGGEACTFEATIELTIEAPDGSVEDTFTTATSGCPERGTWEHTLDLDEAGTWTLTATEPDPSGGEGRPPFARTLELVAGG